MALRLVLIGSDSFVGSRLPAVEAGAGELISVEPNSVEPNSVESNSVE